MEIILITVCVCILVAFLVVTFRLFYLKKELQRFSKEVEKHKDINYAQPLKVTVFDKNLVELAVKMNENLDIQQNLSTQYEKEKMKLNHIISGISHDFRTPLTASLGYLQMIEKSNELTEKNREYLDIVVQKNKYLKELSNEFFELSILESNQENIVMEDVNLSNLISDALIEQYDWIQKRGITPTIHIEDGIIIKSYPRYVIRIVQNLFSNAEKYAYDSFGVRLSENNGRIILSVFNDVRDKNFIDINKVFEPFYKAGSRNKKGTGIGLYVVKCLSEKLGFGVKADWDRSDRFTIYIYREKDEY